jgi:hypothetical protein
MFINKNRAPSRRTFLALCAGVLGAGKAASAQPVELLHSSPLAIAPEASLQGAAGPEVSLKGKLKGGLMGPGGETTGYALMEPRLASSSIEIDMSSIKDAGKLDGKDLLATGSFQMRDYVERRRVLIFKATSAKNVLS